MSNEQLTEDHVDDHDRGLQHDLGVMAHRMVQRRKLLGMFATGGAASLLAACGGGGSDSSTASTTTATTGTTTTTTGTTTTGTTTTTTTGTSSGACIADPTETNGPFPSDGTNSVNGTISNVLTTSGVVRSDIRPSFGISSNVAPGVPVTLTISLVNTNAACAALAGYAIYIWQCDRGGNYSLYSAGVQNENYLRGVQVTDASGRVTFTTIFPAAYSGRYPHIHFEIYPSLAVATTQRNAVLTSQLAMPEALCTAVFNGAAGYTQSITNFAQTPLSRDGVFSDNTAAQIAAMTPTMAGSVAGGFTGTVTIGVAR